MAGTIIGSIDHRIVGAAVSGVSDLQQEQFTILYNMLVAHSNTTLLASNFGTAGTGFDFWDGANPSGEGAWAVFRFTAAAHPFNLMIKWRDNSSWSTMRLTGSNSTDGVGFMIAFREDGTNPWNGSTNANGADTIGTPVWTAGSSTLHVPAVSNTAGGTFATNKNNLHLIGCDITLTANNGRVHFWADDDAIYSLASSQDNGNYQWSMGGLWVPRPGVTASFPFMLLASQQVNYGSHFAQGQVIGSTSGNGTNDGGVVSANPSDLVRPMSLAAMFTELANTTWQPNGQLDTPGFDEQAVMVMARTPAKFGWSGYMNPSCVGLVYNTNNHNTNALATRAYLGNPATASVKWAIPWDGGAAPGTVINRVGRQF